VTLFFEAADGTEFKAQIQERELAVLNPNVGDKLNLSWSSESAHLLRADSRE
ncbi:MAG: TOBE domain-containing protein, partial [Geminicoccaceae bacterium]